ncbi:Iron-sulfur cluster-binding protein [Olavius algarvensis associated proteobacterium Delta 3]|nr:Iron-sulfur cluster-binding protein [Olavius algarvensis associated proteobacterium Delta 3]CAB5130389.1 Iron-sulfur cluster-binding protein [Olavius algarvensis associated proteobacterium Delta 3]
MNAEAHDDHLTRRKFLKRSAKAATAAAAACLVGYRFHDRSGPTGETAPAPDRHIPNFAIPGQPPRIAVSHGGDRVGNFHRAIEALGGLEHFITSGDRVLLKVNAAFAAPPLLGATTHPELIAEVARLCFKLGAAAVFVTDNPINDPVSCFELTGIAEAAREVGAQLLLPREDYFSAVSVDGGRLIRRWPVLYAPVSRANKLIGLATVKDHHRSGASLVMKNWYGLLGGRRNIFHQDIHTIITELAMMVQPTLVVLDGTVSMMTNGPTGGSLSDLKPSETMIVGTDQVAVDALGATLLDRTADSLPFIAMAEKAGVGSRTAEILDIRSDGNDRAGASG